MKRLYFRRRFNVHHRGNERGQTAIILVIALSLFMLAFTGLAVDYSNLWFHRQAAQGAADAACQAAAMDMYVLSQGTPVGGTFNPGFTPTSGASNDCSSSASATPCKYAALNGYDGTGLVTGSQSNSVTFSFPDTVPGVAVPPTSLAPVPFMRVDVVDRARVYLSAVLTGKRTQDVRATAKCGLVLAKSPIPIIILHPTKSGSLSSSGSTATIRVEGGAQRSIQVNSSSKTAVTTGGTIDLSKGGPSGTGSDLGTWGGPTTPTGTFLPGTTGHWGISSPIGDPLATVPAPAQPAVPGPFPPPGWPASCTSSPCVVPYPQNGCPDVANGYCLEYAPGYYPAGITVKNSKNNGVAIFDSGVYWVKGGMSLESNSVVRPSTVDNSGLGGTMFYFSGANSISVDANAGRLYSDPPLPFQTSRVKCAAAGSPDVPANVPATLNGNILLAPCVGTYGDPLGQNRGILFFQDRSTVPSSPPSWQGGGDFLLAGTMYFHQCHADATTLTGTSCSTSAYGTRFELGGNPGSGTYLLGEIITDQLYLHGTPDLVMDLNPNATYNILKVALLQ